MLYTQREVELIAQAAALHGLSQGIDCGFNLAMNNAPIGSTRNRVNGIVETLRKVGYIRGEEAVAL